MFNLYIAYTSYNVLLSLALSASHPEDDNFIILAGNTEKLTKSIETLLRIVPNNNVSYFAFKKSKGNCNLSTFFIKKHNLKVMRDKISSFHHIDKIFYGCEWSVYTTYAVYLLQQINPAADFLFLDDGIFTYADIKLTLKNYVKRLVDRFVYGIWHISSDTYGTLHSSSFICSLFPELLPKRYHMKKHQVIEMSYFINQIDDEVLAEYTKTNGINDIEVIFATDYRWTSYKSNIAAIVAQCCDKKLRTAIKRHPADDGKISFVPPQKCSLVYELEPTTPIELYYMRYRKSLKKIIGGISTSLLMARKMLPDVEINAVVFSDYLKKDKNASQILDFYTRIGIKILMITA